MKKFKSLILASTILLITGFAKLQAAVYVTPPSWGPSGYTGVRYYYLPEVESFYDIQQSKFIYYKPATWYSKGSWVYNGNLPTQYKTYDLNKGRKVVLTKYIGGTPYIYYKQVNTQYPKGYQVKVVGSRPAWIPAGYNARYYYLPDIGTYYDIQASRFIYNNKGKWVRSAYLPPQYKTYSLYGGHKVVMTRYIGPSPYVFYKAQNIRYTNYSWPQPHKPVHTSYQIVSYSGGGQPGYKNVNHGNPQKGGQDYNKGNQGNKPQQKNYPEVKKTYPGNNQPQKGGQNYNKGNQGNNHPQNNTPDVKKPSPGNKPPQNGNKEDDKNKQK